MTNDIQRYGVRHEVFKPTPEGEFVTYKDHERIIAELKQEIQKVARMGLRLMVKSLEQ